MPSRTLTVVRHAHAENARAGQDDTDRSLSVRGQKEAAQSAAAFAVNSPDTDLLLASPSRRTRATVEAFAQALDLDPGAIRYDDRLYLASVDALFDVVQSVDDGYAHVAIIGHNPGLSDFVRALSGDSSGSDLPPAAVRSFDCDARGWRNLRAGSGRLRASR